MTQTNDPGELDWDKGGGLLPAIVQHAISGQVLMQAYMNREALQATCTSGHVTFWSRTRQRLWTKGETSGHYLQLRSIAADCDHDCLLILAEPVGPACHLGTPSCFGTDPPRALAQDLAFLGSLEELLRQRIAERPEGSYTTRLLAEGMLRMAQKVGEEGLELALAAAARDDQAVIDEAADLMYHLVLMINARGRRFTEVVTELQRRHTARGGA